MTSLPFYTPQLHHCFFEIELDRIRLTNKQLQDKLKGHENYIALLQAKCIKNDAFVQQQRDKKQIKRERKRIRTLLTTPLPLIINIIAPEMEAELLELFSNLKNLGDIVKLKEQTENSTKYLCNLKFCKLKKTFDAVKELNDLIGMDEVKNKIFNLICFYTQMNAAEELMHIVIDGPPGVGKTLLGQLIGKVMLSLGMLTNNKFVVATRKDMVGKYLGHTANATQEVIDRAMGGVLFLDEAYSFGHPEKEDSFSKECLDCLNENLTKHKGKFLCIIAGYKKELNSCFFSANQGLQSRFPQSMRMTISGYSKEELHLIFLAKVKKENWIILGDSLQLFKQHHDKMKAYGRDVENVFDQCKILACARIMRSTINFNVHPTILLEDVQQAFKICFPEEEKQILSYFC